MSDSDEDLPGTIHQRQVITQADVSDDDLDDAGVFLAKGQARKAALEEQQRKREEAKAQREEQMYEYLQEAAEARSFDDLSDEQALKEVRKEEL